MFKLNPHYELIEEELLGSKIYMIDNFYNNPQEIEDYLFAEPAPLHKQHESPSFNNIHFEDRRLNKGDKRLAPIYRFLSDLVSQQPQGNKIRTNQTRFYRNCGNDFENCYWWPHQDSGYNGIIYFNEGCECGTNIYKRRGNKVMPGEHYKPWRPKEDFKVLKHLEPKYNRLVFFDGFKFLHGMNICNDRYFSEEYRKNQVFFFDRLKRLKRLENKRQTVRKVAQ